MKSLNILRTGMFVLSILLFLISLTQPVFYLIGNTAGESGVKLMLLGVFNLVLDIGWNVFLLIPYSLSEGQDPNEYFVNIFMVERIVCWGTPILLTAWLFSLMNQKTALLYALVVGALAFYLYYATNVSQVIQPSKIEHLGLGYWLWAGSVLFCNIGLILGIVMENVGVEAKGVKK